MDHNGYEETEASTALRELSKHTINQNMDSRVTRLEESVELKEKLNAFKTKISKGEKRSLMKNLMTSSTNSQYYRMRLKLIVQAVMKESSLRLFTG